MKKPLVVVVSLFSLAIGGAGAWYAKAVMEDKRAASGSRDALAEAKQTVPVTFVITVPEGTPANQRLYLSGSTATLGSWEADGVPLQANDDGTHSVQIDLVNNVEYEYKVTRGQWNTVEQAAGDQELANRTVKAAEAETVAISVAEWVDKGQVDPTVTTRTGTFREHPKQPGAGLELPRDLVVWLPPGYESDDERRYPVIYVQDAQNLFDVADSYQGYEWRLDETAHDMILAGETGPFILVGLGNTEQRTEEFDPTTAKAKAYAAFVVDKAKPLIDATYRTRTGPAHTALVGAGMGAVINFHIVESHPGVFGKVVALAPTQWGSTPEMLDAIAWSGAAWSEVEAWIDHAELGDAMKAAGLAEVQVAPAEEGQNEQEWAQVAPAFLRFLVAPPAGATSNGA
ncbi:MAG: alpha/beta hydrolase-fold protein [Planctomycetota bacterium]